MQTVHSQRMALSPVLRESMLRKVLAGSSRLAIQTTLKTKRPIASSDRNSPRVVGRFRSGSCPKAFCIMAADRWTRSVEVSSALQMARNRMITKEI
jgi:hypothetical protein